MTSRRFGDGSAPVKNIDVPWRIAALASGLHIRRVWEYSMENIDFPHGISDGLGSPV